MGIEPMHKSFADSRLTAWLPGHNTKYIKYNILKQEAYNKTPLTGACLI